MYILGISAFYHDSAACLLKDGEISANIDMLPGDIIIIPEAWF